MHCAIAPDLVPLILNPIILLLTVCPNSLKNGDPLCLNGGRLHSDNSSGVGNEYYTNCAFCDCPEGWGGVDCSRELPTTLIKKVLGLW